KFYDTVVNRLYYACFHATKALLLSKDIIPKTHSGVVGMLHKHFVQESLFDYEQAAFFSRLMQERIEDDYNDFIIPDENEVKEFIEPAKQYVTYVKALLNVPLE
ncbi:MAG: HEPN domain-containing protein, partial [Bacteroidetes bacterium]|nr:HEPN domain-containing protein [Bacteroidota bacterium]